MKLITKFSVLLTMSLLLTLSLKAQWTKIYGPTTPRTDIYFTAADTGYITGTSGSTLKTVNGGSTWNSLNITGFVEQALLFTSDSVGYICGGNQTIKKTTDAGVSWATQDSTVGWQATYLDISFPSANTGYVVGSSGLIKKTVNGGANWIGLSSGTTSNINSVHFINDSIGYIAAPGGLVKKTVDGGVNWVSQTTGTLKQLFSIYFTNALIGYAVGASGTMLKTTNGGTTWLTLTQVTNNNLNDITFVDADTGYVVGDGGTILKTINAGVTWRFQPTGLTTNLCTVSFPDASTGFIAGVDYSSSLNTGIVLKTTNGGGATFLCNPVFIVTQPISASVCAGNYATFNVKAYGVAPYNYRWYKNGVLVDSTIYTFWPNDIYTTTALTSADSGSSIYCVIFSRCWGNTTTQITSDTVNLGVIPACTAVTLLTPSLGYTYYSIGSPPPIFTVNVAGTPPFVFRWYLNNILLQTNAISATSSTFQPGLGLGNYTPGSRSISCTVTNCFVCGTGSGGGAGSVTCSGTVDIQCPIVSLSIQPQSQTKTTCQTATFNISNAGWGFANIGWFKNGNYIPGANSSTYTTPPLTFADNGSTYYCRTTSCYGNLSHQSNTATLTIIQPASIVQQPANQNLLPGTTATFNASVNGPPPFSYYWYTNGVLSSTTLNTTSTTTSFTTPLLNSGDISNSYYCTITNGTGCYSVTSDTAHFNCETYNSISPTACDSFSINGQTYTTSGIYTQTLVNHTGCDSILTIHLTLTNFNNSIVQQPINQQIIAGTTATFTASINGNSPFSYFWYNNGVLIDSVINTTSTISSYTTPSLSLLDIGNYYYCVITFGAGCDTITSDTARFICTSSNSISPVACDSISINGQNYASSGVYTQTLSNQYGCDSTLTINLTITNLVDSILQNGSTLSSSIAGANYQWVDCENGLAPIAGATNQTFNPTVNGFYALIINKGLCVDTSACYNVNSVGINILDFEEGISIFPSPVKNVLQIASTSLLINEINLYNSIGALLIEQKQNKKQLSIDLSSYAKGIYFVEVKTATKIFRRKVLKE